MKGLNIFHQIRSCTSDLGKLITIFLQVKYFIFFATCFFLLKSYLLSSNIPALTADNNNGISNFTLIDPLKSIFFA